MDNMSQIQMISDVVASYVGVYFSNECTDVVPVGDDTVLLEEYLRYTARTSASLIDELKWELDVIGLNLYLDLRRLTNNKKFTVSQLQPSSQYYDTTVFSQHGKFCLRTVLKYDMITLSNYLAFTIGVNY